MKQFFTFHFSLFTSSPEARKGQAIALVALTILILCLSAFMTINTGVIFYRRIQMQNAADCAALSATKILARSLNTIALNNNLIYGLPGLTGLPPVFWGGGDMLKDLKGAYETFRGVQTAWVRAGSGQAFAVGYKVARLNGADRAYPTGSFSMKLKGRNLSVRWWKIVEIPFIGSIPVPCPPFRTRYRPAYYRRRWATDTKKAQPTHTIKFTVIKNEYRAFGKSLFGGKVKEKKTYANAKAKLFYDVKRSYWAHYGGFPRSRNASWLEKSFLAPPGMFNPWQFNTYLVPVGVTYLH